MDSAAFVGDHTEFGCSIILLLFQSFEILSSFVCLLLDLCEEVQESFSVRLEHLLGAKQTRLPHFVVVRQSLDLGVLGLVQLLR